MEVVNLLSKLKKRMNGRINCEYCDDFLLSELENAMYKVAEKRWCDTNELEDKYENAVINVALYNIALIGGDFQTSHSENGINRAFITEQEVLKQVTPKARAL